MAGPELNISESEIQTVLNGPDYFVCPAAGGARMKKTVCVTRQTSGIKGTWGNMPYRPMECKDCQVGRDIIKEVKVMENQSSFQTENDQEGAGQGIVNSKPCNKCGIVKPLDDYPKNKECKDGHEGQCKECKNAHTRERMKKKRKGKKAGTPNQPKTKRIALPGHPRFYELVEEMARIHQMKNQDYGGGDPLGNFREAEKIGIEPWRGALVRLLDKYSRVTSLVNGRQVKDENIKDTLLDLANYAVLTIVLMEEKGLDNE